MRERQVTSLKIGSRTWWHGDYWEVRGFVDGFVQLGLRDQAATVAIKKLLVIRMLSAVGSACEITGNALITT